jgi:hypothetical protein
MHTGDIRTVVDPMGDNTYYARLAPLERPRGGISQDMKTLVLENAEGVWVGSTPVYGNVRLWTLTEDDLQRLASRVIARD